ncbi:monoacylglycerol lipase [Phoenix dactylifera]|uniref:Monoacylglycerol lipase n=1 Tax=Phoenix dactylifera TaxID=42345 RepID=A0A8B7CUV5_PHODC|nr:monoacylglycerol lipase [Phoenix dactylifera]
MLCIGASLAVTRIPQQRQFHEERSRSLGIQRRRSSIEMDSAIKPATAIAPPRPLIMTSGSSGRVNALLSLVSLHALRSLLQLLNGFILLLLLPFRRRTVVVSAADRPPATVAVAGEVVSGARKGAGSGGAMVLTVPAAMLPWWPRESQEAAARRGMAIRRMGVEEEEDEGRRSERGFALFTTARGDTLFTQSWAPVSVQTKGLVVLLHGLNEHSGRYNYFAKQLNDNGFKVYAMDWIGHGGSDWLHGYVHSLNYAVDDLKAFLEKILLENPGLPCFCFGHSTGGAIVLKAALDPKVKVCVEGVVLTSPAIGVQPSHPIVAVIAPIFSLLVPKYQFSGSYRSGPPVSRDPEAVRAKYSDPLVFTGSLRVRTGHEILRITSYLQQNLSKVAVPFLVLHGTADTVTDPEASQRLYNEASSTDKSIKLYEGFLHDLLFEPERDHIAKDIIDWLNARLDAINRA